MLLTENRAHYPSAAENPAGAISDRPLWLRYALGSGSAAYPLSVSKPDSPPKGESQGRYLSIPARHPSM